MEADSPSVGGLAVTDGLISALGDEAEILALAGAETEIVDLAGRTLMPGFIDAHSHLALGSLKLAAVAMESPPAGPINSIADIQTALRIELQRQGYGGEKWLIGWGYDHSRLAEQRHPTKADLDEVSREVPIYLYHYSAHQAVVNSAALTLLGVDADTPDPEGGHIARLPGSREPSGLLEETAMISANLLAMRSLKARSDRKALVEEIIEIYVAQGFTTAPECSCRTEDMELLAEMAGEARLKIDVPVFVNYAYMQPEEAAKQYSPDYQGKFRVAGQKLMLDGGSPGRTAYLREPYHQQMPDEENYRGYARMAQRQINEFVTGCYRNDVPLVIHALGDAALDQCIIAVNVGEYAAPGEDRRTQLIHLQQVQEDQFDRLRDLDVTLTFQVTHNFYFGDFHREVIYGPERAARLNPVASALARGLSVTIHHDFPVHPIDQIMLIWTAVTRRTRSGQVIGAAQKISVMDALKASTINAAYQFREEHRKGSLKPGKLADLIILSDNPLTMDPENLRDLKVMQTIKEGQVIYRAE